MSNKKNQPKNKSNHDKRTTKPAAQGGGQVESQPKKHDDKPKGSLFKKVAAIFFSVLLILAFAVPSVSVLMSGNQSADSSYESQVSDIQSTIDSDPSEMVNYLTLADLYYQWATNVLDGSVESSHDPSELFQDAITNYKKYLSSTNDTDAVENMALSYYYTGDVSTAQSTLEAQTKKDPSNAMLWAQLGLVYQNNNQKDKAKTAYNKAISLDPNDKTGAKSFAQQQLESIS